MGGGSSRLVTPAGGGDSPGQEGQSLGVDLQLLDQQLQDLFTFKILCLGAGESGKSTVVKQLKLIHKKALEAEEMELVASSLHSNLLDCVKALAHARRSFELPELADSDAATERRLLEHDDQSETRLPADIAQPLLDLVQSAPYQAAYARRSEFWILDSFPYCLKHVHRFLSPDFAPTEEDAVMARVRTTGIVESLLEHRLVKEEEDEPELLRFHVVDVGGQRNERKKWIHCFSDVSAILFIVNTAGYNSVLFEDASKNRLQEELELFEQITGMPIFANTPIALFLNKKDLFESAIAEVPLSRAFPEYNGDNSLSSALQYIEAEFQRRLPSGKSVRIAHVSARWKRDIKSAFEDVKRGLYDAKRAQLMTEMQRINKQRKQMLAKQQQQQQAAASQEELHEQQHKLGSAAASLRSLLCSCGAVDDHAAAVTQVTVGAKNAE